MKQRVITGLLIILVLIPIFISKMVYEYDYIIYGLGLILVVVAMSEMISMKETEKVLPYEIHFLSYLSVIYLTFYNSDVIFSLPEKFKLNILPYLLIFLVIIMVLRQNFKIVEASFVLFAIYYIGLSFNSLVYLLEDGYELLFIALIAMFTDTFAYFVGSKIGKHKLCPKISPKKTIEGSVGGTLIATLLVTVYALIVSNHVEGSFMDDYSLPVVIGMTLILSVISQIGDLAASVMKRHFKIKDYGRLFPGHGGVLDRLDSILFTSLTYFYLIELISLF